MRAVVTCLISLALGAGSAAMAATLISTASVTLPASGEAAGRNNPSCTDGYTPTTAQMVQPKIYKALDEYAGFPIASTLSSVIPGFNSWFAARMGVHNGPSTCASQCLVASTSNVIKACMSDSNDGTQCKVLTNGDGPLAWAGTEGMTKELVSRGRTLTCTTGKNWSDDRTRSFWLTAEDS